MALLPVARMFPKLSDNLTRPTSRKWHHRGAFLPVEPPGSIWPGLDFYLFTRGFKSKPGFQWRPSRRCEPTGWSSSEARMRNQIGVPRL